ncbi:MAG: glycosyltransferase family 4 protein [Pikeienuella sp.]
MKTIIHLVEEGKYSDINEIVAFFENSPEMNVLGRHEVVEVKRGGWKTPQVEADMIVSHLAVCWKNFPFFVALRASYARAPIVHVEHDWSGAYVKSIRRMPGVTALLKASFALFDRVVAVSDAQAKWLDRAGVVPDQKLRAIRACIRLDRYLGVAPKTRSGPLTIGAIGDLNNQAGLDILIEAMRKVSPETAELIIWGEGGEHEALEKLAGDMSHVALAGEPATPEGAYAACDVVAIPARWAPSGLRALIAHAAARPTLTSQIDGLPEYAIDGGYEVTANTPEAWAELIIEMADQNLSTKSDFARFAAEGAERHFYAQWRMVVDELFSDTFTGEADAA